MVFLGIKSKPKSKYAKVPTLNKSLEQGQNLLLGSVIESYKPQPYCDDNTDILSIHMFVNDKLSKKPDLSSLTEAKQQLLKALNNHPTPVKYSALQLELNKIEEAERILVSGDLQRCYLHESQSLVDEWKAYTRQQEVTIDSNKCVDSEKLFLVRQFIQIVRKYVPDIQFTLPHPNRNDLCSHCWSTMEANDDDTYYCHTCDNHRTFTIAEFASDNIERITTVSNYSNLVTFHKVLECHEGRQKPNWDPEKNLHWNIDTMTVVFIDY